MEPLRYIYGMRLRGFSPGCQPKAGLIGRRDDESGKYYDLIAYGRPLTEEEQRDYELDQVSVVPERAWRNGNVLL